MLRPKPSTLLTSVLHEPRDPSSNKTAGNCRTGSKISCMGGIFAAHQFLCASNRCQQLRTDLMGLATFEQNAFAESRCPFFNSSAANVIDCRYDCCRTNFCKESSTYSALMPFDRSHGYHRARHLCTSDHVRAVASCESNPLTNLADDQQASFAVFLEVNDCTFGNSSIHLVVEQFSRNGLQ